MRRTLISILLSLPLSLAACGESATPEFDGDARPSAAGRFVGEVRSDPPVPPINSMHTWTLHLETADGVPIDGAQISVDGDMPAHGHGLPTEPRVTEELGGGDYLVEGMQFQMGGEWYVEFSVVADGVEDVLRFEFVL